MTNKIKVAEQNDVVIATISPDLDQHDYLEMRQFFNLQFFSKGKFKIVINCENVKDLPSIAFGVFCSLTRDTRRMGGNVTLVNVADSLKKIMSRTHIDKQVKLIGTLDEAIDFYLKPNEH